MPSLINMENTPAEAKEMVNPAADGGPKYPWGLCITLNNDSLEKLGVKTLPTVGTEVTIIAKATISAGRVNATEADGTSSSMDLQITDMQIDGLHDDLFGRAAEVLYGKAK